MKKSFVYLLVLGFIMFSVIGCNSGAITEEEYVIMIEEDGGEGDWEKVLSIIKEMLNSYPDSIEAHVMAGQIYLDFADMDNANYNAKNHLLKAEELLLAGHIPRTDALQGYAKEEMLSAIYFYLGQVALNDGQEREALDYFTHSYDLAGMDFTKARAAEMIELLSE